MTLTKRLLLILLPTVVLLGMFEVGARLLYFFNTGRDVRYLIAPLGGVQAPVVFPYRPRETYTQVDSCTGRQITLTINREGGRGADWEISKPPGTVRIAAVGGSSTFGVNNPDDGTWPAYLEALLRARKGSGIEVLNAGLPGYALKDFNEFVGKNLLKYRPDWVLYYEGWNDTDLPAASQVHHNVRRFHEQTAFGRLSNLLYRRSMFYTYLLEKTQFILVSERSGILPDTVRFQSLLEDFIRRVRRQNATPVLVLQVLEPSGLPTVLELEQKLSGASLDRKDLLEQWLREALAADGRLDVDPVTKLRLYQTQILLEVVRRVGREQQVQVIDPLSVFRSSPERALLFCDVVHLTDRGNQLLAEQVADQMEGMK